VPTGWLHWTTALKLQLVLLAWQGCRIFLKLIILNGMHFLIGFQACIDENAKGMVAIYN